MMMSLAASRFRVSYENDEYKVFELGRDGITEVTNTMNDEDKDELIDDLIYAVSELLKERSKVQKNKSDLMEVIHSLAWRIAQYQNPNAYDFDNKTLENIMVDAGLNREYLEE